MGGSAASCVAALVAGNALLDAPVAREALYPFALRGESIASGSRNGDNVAPMLLGGLVLATSARMVRIPVPAAWHCVLVHPAQVLKTLRSREVLHGDWRLGDFVEQSGTSRGVERCHQGDAEMFRAGLRDVLVEPGARRDHRRRPVPVRARSRRIGAGFPGRASVSPVESRAKPKPRGAHARRFAAAGGLRGLHQSRRPRGPLLA